MLLHLAGSDLASQRLIKRIIGDQKRFAQGHIPLPGILSLITARIGHNFIQTGHGAGRQADQGVRDIEGPGRCVALVRAAQIESLQTLLLQIKQHKGSVHTGLLKKCGNISRFAPVHR